MVRILQKARNISTVVKWITFPLFAEIKTSRTAGQQDEQKVARKLYTLSTLPGSSDEDYMYAVNNKANNSLQ